MVLVPRGRFQLGSFDPFTIDNQETTIAFDEPFWIDVDEVSNLQFESLNGVAGQSSRFTADNQPRDSVNWFEARDFCSLRGSRLPTGPEWEFAARGPDNLVFPWVNSFSQNLDLYDDILVFELNSNGQTAIVGSRPDGNSWVGASDMMGNVIEWVNTALRGYPYDANDGREDPSIPSIERELRGGSYQRVSGWRLPDRIGDLPSSRSVQNRQYYDTDDFDTPFGFRCARDFDPADLTSSP